MTYTFTVRAYMSVVADRARLTVRLCRYQFSNKLVVLHQGSMKLLSSAEFAKFVNIVSDFLFCS